MIAVLPPECIAQLNKDLPGYGDYLVESGRVVTEEEESVHDTE